MRDSPYGIAGEVVRVLMYKNKTCFSIKFMTLVPFSRGTNDNLAKVTSRTTKKATKFHPRGPGVDQRNCDSFVMNRVD